MSKPDRSRLAASYARKSTPDDQGIRDQHEINVEAAGALGLMVPDHPDFRFGDDDTTGAATSRADLDRLKDLILTDPPFSVVYVKDMTRLGRFSNPRHYFFLMVLFEQSGIEVRYSNRGAEGPTDPDDMGSFLKEVVDTISATQERRSIIDRVTKGMRQSVLHGFFPGNAPYATERWYADRRSGEVGERVDEDRRLQRTTETRFVLRWKSDGSTDVVRQIFEWYVDGQSLRSIAARLVKEGVPSPSGGKAWYAKTVRAILSNPLYKGDYIWARTASDEEPLPREESQAAGTVPILVKDYMADPPVSRELYSRVEELLSDTMREMDSRKRRSPHYLLSGLLRCSACGARLHGYTSTDQYPTRRRYYRHEHRVTCPVKRYLPAERLEMPIVEAIRALLRDGELIGEAEEALRELSDADREEKLEAEEAGLRRDRKKKKAVLERLMELSVHKSASVRKSAEERIEDAGAELDRLNRRIEELKREGKEIARLAAAIETRTDQVAELDERFAVADPKVRQTVLRELITHVEVDPESEQLSVHVVALS